MRVRVIDHMTSNGEEIIVNALDQEAKKELKETTEAKTKMNGRIIQLLIGKSPLAKTDGILEVIRRKIPQTGMTPDIKPLI